MEKDLLQFIYQPSTCIAQQDLQAYLKGDIKVEKRKQIESHIMDCELCAEAVEGYQEAGIVELEKHIPLEDSVLWIQSETGKSKIFRIKHFPDVLLRIAAVVSILLVSYFTFFRPPSNEQLFTQYYSSYPSDIPINQRNSGSENVLNSDFISGLQEYSNMEFSSSLIHFEKARESAPENPAVKFFSGLACMETGNYDQAIDFLSETKNTDSLYAYKAAWYLALSYLKLGDKAKAVQYLDELILSGTYKSGEAKKLRNKLQ